MLQNIYAAGKSREPSASDFHLKKFSRAPTIIGKRKTYEDDHDADVDLEEDLKNLEDVSKWASGKSSTEGAKSEVLTAHETIPMPRWLASMSKDDGAPDWLEAIKPEHAHANTEDSTIYASNVHGALMELEKWVPTAGLAMVQVFFPMGLKYREESIRDNVHKKFWQRAYFTRDVRKAAEEKRRREETRQGNSKIQDRLGGSKSPLGV